MALKKFATVLLMEILVLPIVLEARFYHGYDSYRQYYDNRINSDERLKYPLETSEESYYDHNNDVKEEINSRFGDDKHTNFDSSFVFPDDVSQARSGRGNYVNAIGPAANCDHMQQTFCEDVPNYPEEFVSQALAKNSSLFHYAYNDVLTIAPRTDISDEEPLCLVMERVIRPKTGQNLENKWRYILQSDESNFFQGVRIETCREENTKCRMIDDFAAGYITTCKQKYIYRELSAIDNGEIVRDYFRFPASCCCHIQFNAEDGVFKMRIQSASKNIPEFRPRIT